MEEINEIIASINEVPDTKQKLGLYIEAAQKALAASKSSLISAEQTKFKEIASQLISEAEELKRAASVKRLEVKDLHSALPANDQASASGFMRDSDGPQQDRELSVAEQKILWLSSRVNGHTFPPWTRVPNASDFELGSDNQPFRDRSDMSLSPHQLDNFDRWARPEEAIPPPAWFSDRENMTPSMQSHKRVDLVQDTALDCSVVASLCTDTARSEKGYSSILSNVIYPMDAASRQPIISPNGRYLFRLNFNGCFRAVEIDDCLPLSNSKRMLHIVDRNNPQLLWPALLEKAYLKVRGGYDFPGSNSNTDLWILAGWIPEIIFLEQSNPKPLWDRISDALDKGNVLLTLGTGKMSKAAEQELGLVGQHNYVILNLKERDGREMVLIKNPWCETTLWTTLTGTPEKTSSETAPATRPRLQQRPLSRIPPVGDIMAPGTFWMTLGDVFRNFESLYMNWNPCIFNHRQDIHFNWDLTTAHHASHSLTQSPQFSLQASKGGIVWLLLSRHFQTDSKTRRTTDALLPAESPSESVKDGTTGYTCLFVFDNDGKRVYDEIGAVKQGPFVDSMQTLLRLEMPPAKTYTIALAEQYLADKSHSFTLKAYSMEPTKLSHVQEKYLHSITYESGWNAFNCGGSTSSPAFAINPQFRLEIEQRTPVAILLESCEGDLNINVKLCYGQGKRVYNIRRQDIILDSYEYRKGSSFVQTKDQMIEPGMYTIITSTFESGQTGKFGLRIDSNTKVTVQQLPSEEHGKLSLQLPRAIFQGQTSKIGLRLIPLRSATLTIIVKFSSSYVPPGEPLSRTTSSSSIANHGPGGLTQLRSPLRLSLQLGRGPFAEEIIASFGGEFSDATIAGLRLFDFPVYQELARQGDLYLIVERLGRGASGSEERYNAEILMADVDSRAVEAGLWEILND